MDAFTPKNQHLRHTQKEGAEAPSLVGKTIWGITISSLRSLPFSFLIASKYRHLPSRETVTD